MVQLARVIYSNIYREDDKPECKFAERKSSRAQTNICSDRRGNRVLIGICCMNMCVYAGGKFFYMWLNKKRDREWNAMTEEVWFDQQSFSSLSLILFLGETELS